MFISPTQKIQDRIIATSVACRYDVSIPTIYRWMAAGRFPRPMRSGGKVFWTQAMLDNFDKQTKQESS